ncbi:hypothetical protein ACIRRI_53635 [Streptomyces mirabilis]|uniref:hypothetical protein n=1 Tax=Streptomyces mirabilis TaxID=68239 RepID=UPI00382056A9
MELEVTGTLPQAVGYPGSTTEVLHFSVAKSRWIDQINALGPSVASEMRVPFPLEDGPRTEYAFLAGGCDDSDGIDLDQVLGART